MHEHFVTSEVTATETGDGLVISFPAARKSGSQQGSTGAFLGLLWKIIACLAIVVGIWAALPLLRGLPEFAVRVVSWLVVTASGIVAVGSYVFLSDAVLVRWAPFRIELVGKKLLYGRRLGPLSDANELNVDDVLAVTIWDLPDPKGRYPPAGHLTVYGREQSWYLISEEYPFSWLEPVAQLLVERINRNRAGTLEPLRVTGLADPIPGFEDEEDEEDQEDEI